MRRGKQETAAAKVGRNPLLTKPLEYIAFWQFLTFGLLCTLVWVNYALDLPTLLYGADAAKFEWISPSILSAGVIVVAFVTIGHTYLQERRAIQGLITVCSYCRRVRLKEDAWAQMEEFVADKTTADFTHGICPTCYENVMAKLDDRELNPAIPDTTAAQGTN